MIRRELRHGWTVEALDGPAPEAVRGRVLPATVPGIVHQDLLAAGLIDDPLFDEHEAQQHWIGETGWRYAVEFDWTPGPERRHDLVFEGIDTVAVITLNGVELGATANQHRTYRYPVEHVLRHGRNSLVVELRSPMAYMREMIDLVGDRPRIPADPFPMIRKSACNFGWDWGPRVVTSGLWREVSLESWSDVRLAAVRVSASADRTARVNVELEHEHDGSTAEVSCAVGDVAVTSTMGSRGHVTLAVPEAALWWPRGYGDAALHDLRVRVGDDERTFAIGFRTIELDTEPDEHGIPFEVRVNGQLVPARGVNWIPPDVFPSRVDAAMLDARLADAVELGSNTIRVWGGGVYESDAFYDRCDRLGLLVWQDFAFSCAAYPEEEPLWSEVEAEARDAVNRLASHPSLALWNGSNENLWGIRQWGWEDLVRDVTWGRGYYERLLPAVVAELDPERSYIPSSPYSVASTDQNDPRDALTHLWDVWNSEDYEHYADAVPRFVSEFGLQGPAALSTLRAGLSERPLDPAFGHLHSHQKGIDGAEKLEHSYGDHLPRPDGFEAWHWTTQLNQARGLRFGIEHLRAAAPVCRGILVWQLNDCWPAVSWSLVDSAGVRKPVWFAVRSGFAEQLPVLGERDVILVNDSRTPVRGLRCTVSRVDARGTVAASVDLELDADPGAVTRSALPVELRRRAGGDGIVVLAVDGVTIAYRLDREPAAGLALESADYDVQLTTGPAGLDVEVTARTVLVDVTLLADQLAAHATVDSGLVTLLPGERHVFRTSGVDGVSESAVRAALRTLNDLVAMRENPERRLRAERVGN